MKRRTQWLQETRQMRFEKAYTGWTERRLTQEEAADLLGVCARTFRRYIHRYEEEGLDGLLDKRLCQLSSRRAPADEVMRLVKDYQRSHEGWNVKHYHAWYRREGGLRSYNWVRTKLQAAGVVRKARRRGTRRKRRERAALPGMLLHQDASTHAWVVGQHWDLVSTMDDATGEQYSMFFCEEEGTESSFRGIRDVIEQKGLFCSLYTDRASHYWHTPQAGGKVDRQQPTQFGQAMRQLGIKMTAAYSPQARGRSERAFRTHQGRLPQELAAAGITDMDAANRYLKEVYLPAFNQEFCQPARAAGSAFVDAPHPRDLDNALCEIYERVVGKDNCVHFQGQVLQLPPERHRYHYIKARVKVRQHLDGTVSISHGPRRLARYSPEGKLLNEPWPDAA